MKKFLKTLAVCFMGFIILVIAQLIGVGAGQLSALVIPEFVGGIISAILYPVLTYYGLKFFCKKFLETELLDLGIVKFSLNPVWCIVAVGLPLIVDILLILTGGKWYILECDVMSKLNTVITGICLYSIAGGIVEEMIFRGLIMGIIRKNYSIKPAVIIPSVLFGLAHLANGKLDFISAIQLIIAGTAVGIMFSLVMLNENNFWNNTLVHAVWNMSTLGLMHIGTMYIGPENDNSALFNFVLKSDNRLITGGDFGIESSVIAIVGYVAVSIIALIMIKKENSKKFT
ncbi:MAG: CPBP family intramembrane metalloprotease [Ruminococcus sp.]|nr:CPBP family intramembrane metalloprotease [Ruminococcus sp.]